MVESQRQISAPTVLPEDTQELNPPLGPRDDSCDALHPEKDEDTPETWMHGPSEGSGVCVCVFCSPCLGWLLMLLWCPVSDYLLNYRRESCRATDCAAACTARSPHLTSCFRSVRNGVLESGGGRAGVDEHCDRNSFGSSSGRHTHVPRCCVTACSLWCSVSSASAAI